MVALVDVRAEALGGFDSQPNLGLAEGRRARRLEARVGKDAEHRSVVRHHLGDELLDPCSGGGLREPLEHARSDAAALVVVGHGECDLGGPGVDPYYGRGRINVARALGIIH